MTITIKDTILSSLLAAGMFGSAYVYMIYKNNQNNVKTNKPIKIAEGNYILQERNVIGDSRPEKFIEINGQRYYVQIDGKPVENYFPKVK